MTENPEYLRNQSRYVHALHRRQRTWLKWSLILWSTIFVGLSIASALNLILGFGWQLGEEDVWTGLLFAAFAVPFWLFARLIMGIVLGVSRRKYGPDSGPST